MLRGSKKIKKVQKQQQHIHSQGQTMTFLVWDEFL